MQLRYNYRIYPTPGQRIALARAFGCARVVYNDVISARREAYQAGAKYPSAFELQKRLITEAKRTPERAFLAGVSHSMLQLAVNECDRAYRAFFDSLSGKRKGPKVQAPRFKSRKDRRQTIRFTGKDPFRLRENGRLFLSKIGDIEVRWSRVLPSSPSSVTVTRTADGRYFASFVVTVEQSDLDPVLDVHGRPVEVGIDLGLTAFAVDSSGRTTANPRFLKRAEKRLAKAQKALDRKAIGSSNRAKARLRVARLHARVANTRNDWLHKDTTRLIRENQAIYIEDLNVAALRRTRMAKSVGDVGWGTWRALLEYKTARYGRDLVKVDRWFPSTRTCSSCGVVGDRKPLNVRKWTCPCGAVHDRDHNAAKNILAAGRAERLNACGGDVSPGLASAVAGEAGTHRDALWGLVGISAVHGGEDVKSG